MLQTECKFSRPLSLSKPAGSILSTVRCVRAQSSIKTLSRSFCCPCKTSVTCGSLGTRDQSTSNSPPLPSPLSCSFQTRRVSMYLANCGQAISLTIFVLTETNKMDSNSPKASQHYVKTLAKNTIEPPHTNICFNPSFPGPDVLPVSQNLLVQIRVVWSEVFSSRSLWRASITDSTLYFLMPLNTQAVHQNKLQCLCIKKTVSVVGISRFIT